MMAKKKRAVKKPTKTAPTKKEKTEAKAVPKQMVTV